MNLKRNLYQLMTWSPVNNLLKFTLKPIVHGLPISLLERIPVMGPIKIQVDLQGGKILCLETDGGDVVAGMIYWLGLEGFEGASINLFLKLLRHSRTFIDIGANTGIYALLAGMDDPNRAAYAFEPMPNVFASLLTNIKSNHLQNVYAMQSAVTNFDGQAQFYTYPSVRLPYISSMRELHQGALQIMVPATTLDSFVKDEKVSNIDLLKIDTESTEPSVLEGAQQTLQRDEPIIICEVLTGGMTEDRIHSYLAPLTYKYYLITPQGLIEKKEIVGDHLNGNFNYLFVPESKMALFEQITA